MNKIISVALSLLSLTCLANISNIHIQGRQQSAIGTDSGIIKQIEIYESDNESHSINITKSHALRTYNPVKQYIGVTNYGSIAISGYYYYSVTNTDMSIYGYPLYKVQDKVYRNVNCDMTYTETGTASNYYTKHFTLTFFHYDSISGEKIVDSTYTGSWDYGSHVFTTYPSPCLMTETTTGSTFILFVNNDSTTVYDRYIGSCEAEILRLTTSINTIQETIVSTNTVASSVMKIDIPDLTYIFPGDVISISGDEEFARSHSVDLIIEH